MKEDMENTIQALVDGELSAKQRQAFLQKLDTDSSGHWRTLALAFTESQIIKEGLDAYSASSKKSTFLPNLMKLAAVLVIGFVAGYLVHQFPQENSEPEMVSAQSEEVDALNPEVIELAQSRITRISDAVSEQGYDHTLETTLIKADLGEGRSLVIPLNRLLIASRK